MIWQHIYLFAMYLLGYYLWLRMYPRQWALFIMSPVINPIVIIVYLWLTFSRGVKW